MLTRNVRSSGPDLDQRMVEAAASMQVAVSPPARSHRFVASARGSRGLAILIDGVPRRSRTAIWERVVEAAITGGSRMTAWQTVPRAGRQDHHVKAGGFFGDKPDLEFGPLEAWAEAHRAQGGG